MPDSSAHLEELLSRALDGEITDAERARIESDPALSDALETMRAAEARLSALFPPAQAPEGFTFPEAPPRVLRFHRAKEFALAASLALVAALWFLTLPKGIEINGASMFYGVSAHMEPSYVCTTQDEFETYTRDELGVAITAAFGSPVELIGWRAAQGQYGDEQEGPKGRVLLARSAQGEPALVFFLGPGYAPPAIDPKFGLKVHTAKIGSVRLYEVSEQPDAFVLPLLKRAGS